MISKKERKKETVPGRTRCVILQGRFSVCKYWRLGVMLNGPLNGLLNELEQIKEIALPHWIGNVDV